MDCDVSINDHEVTENSVTLEINMVNVNPAVKKYQLVVTDVNTQEIVFDDELLNNKGYKEVDNLSSKTEYDFKLISFHDNTICGEHIQHKTYTTI